MSNFTLFKGKIFLILPNTGGGGGGTCIPKNNWTGFLGQTFRDLLYSSFKLGHFFGHPIDLSDDVSVCNEGEGIAKITYRNYSLKDRLGWSSKYVNMGKFNFKIKA